MGRCCYCLSCVKISLLVCNTLLWLLGAAYIAFSVWHWVIRVSDDPPASNGIIPFYLDYVLVGLGGALLVFMGYIGCVGGLKEFKPLLHFYAVILLVLIVGQVVVAIYRSSEGSDTWKVALENTWYELPLEDLISTEQSLKCCGFLGYKDYTDQTWDKPDPFQTLPYSCCVRGLDGEIEHATKCQSLIEGYYIKQGCYDYALHWVGKMPFVLGFVVLILIGIVTCFFCLVFALCLSVTISRRREVKDVEELSVDEHDEKY